MMTTKLLFLTLVTLVSTNAKLVRGPYRTTSLLLENPKVGMQYREAWYLRTAF
jgi:hypothetical protein